MAATGLNYTAAAVAIDAPFEPGLLSITEAMQERECDYAEAVGFLTDPANREMCEVCGWTWGMICPECSGCGCDRYCTGWRHGEWGPEDDDRPGWECPECGGDDSEYGCQCE
jgi:hypothetical protein